VAHSNTNSTTTTPTSQTVPFDDDKSDIVNSDFLSVVIPCLCLPAVREYTKKQIRGCVSFVDVYSKSRNYRKLFTWDMSHCSQFIEKAVVIMVSFSSVGFIRLYVPFYVIAASAFIGIFQTLYSYIWSKSPKEKNLIAVNVAFIYYMHIAYENLSRTNWSHTVKTCLKLCQSFN